MRSMEARSESLQDPGHGHPQEDEVLRLGLAFDVILLSAVWMHVATADRPRAFRKLVSLLRPGGVLAMSLRHGPSEPGRTMHDVSVQEIEVLAKAHAVSVIREHAAEDALGRQGITWSHVAMRLPDDATGALPLLRHVILNDSKSATYKLGLLRAVARAADSAQGMARADGDDYVSLPLGLIGLIWLRLYKPLLDAGLPQTPTNIGTAGLGFVKQAYMEIADLAPLDLRVGARFAGRQAEALHKAVRDAVVTIVAMPAHFLTYPGTDVPVLTARSARAPRAPSNLLVDEAYLHSFGEVRVPQHLWQALARYDAWIEPALTAEWVLLMFQYAERQERALDHGVIAQAMVWGDPPRDVGFARKRALDLAERRPLFCVWTGKRLSAASIDIDHCLPWSAWACDDLWNLMPADAAVNRNAKRQRLPSAVALEQARERILGWWEDAYVADGGGPITERFFAEAASSLPAAVAGSSLAGVFEGAATRRLALRSAQQVEEWTPKPHRATGRYAR